MTLKYVFAFVAFCGSFVPCADLPTLAFDRTPIVGSIAAIDTVSSQIEPTDHLLAETTSVSN